MSLGEKLTDKDQALQDGETIICFHIIVCQHYASAKD